MISCFAHKNIIIKDSLTIVSLSGVEGPDRKNLLDLDTKKASQNDSLLRDPGTIRTFDRLLRRQMLYPAELWDLLKSEGKGKTL